MIRIGIVGCGRILAAHLRGYRLLRAAGVDDFRITALAARRADDARSYLRRGEGPPQRLPVSGIPGDPLAVGDEYLADFQDDVDVEVHTDYREMIARAPVDAVNDFTPHGLHHLVASACFEHGKHLLTQKPLAVTVEAGRRMCDEAEARGLALGVFENHRFKAPTRHLRWLVDSQRLGALEMILFANVGTWWAPDRIVARTPWRHRLVEGGGISLDMGVHHFHLVRHVAGEVKDIEARTAVLERLRVTRDGRGEVVERVECDADDTYWATFETETGVRGSLVASWAGHGGSTVLGDGPVFHLAAGRVCGSTIDFDDGAAGDLAQLYEEGCPADRRAREFARGLSDAFALTQLDWLRAIRERREPEVGGREGLRDLACAYAILESDRLGRRVEVEEVASGALREVQRPMDERLGLSGSAGGAT